MEHCGCLRWLSRPTRKLRQSLGRSPARTWAEISDVDVNLFEQIYDNQNQTAPITCCGWMRISGGFDFFVLFFDFFVLLETLEFSDPSALASEATEAKEATHATDAAAKANFLEHLETSLETSLERCLKNLKNDRLCLPCRSCRRWNRAHVSLATPPEGGTTADQQSM